jgi:hypothetical protein
MKNILFVALMAITTVSANASTLEINGPLDTAFYNAGVNEDKSYFDTLGDMFSSGTKPSPSMLVNKLWAGRCFDNSTPNDPRNGAYLFRKVVSDVGPIGDNREVYEASSVTNSNKGPNYFDHLTLKDVTKNLDPSVKYYHKVTSTSNSLVSGNDAATFHVKLSGKYLVQEIREINKAKAGPISQPEEVYARCYYFIPEYKNP